MNTISPIKFLTAVGFLIVSLSAGSLLGAETKEACIARKSKELKKACLSETDPQKKSYCVGNANSEAGEDSECVALDSKEDIKDKESKCDSAIKDYNDAAKDARGACESFEKVSGGGKNSCQARIDACSKKIGSAVAGGSNPDETETSDEKQSGAGALTSLVSNLVMQKYYPNAATGGASGNKSASPSCVNYKSKEDRKEKKNDKKDLDREISKIKEKIADEKKKITEENAKLREKNADIDADIQKVDAAVKKAIRSVDEKTGERLRASNEELAKNATNIRNINAVIVKRKEDAETAKFDYQQKMVQYTEDKINTQCQTAIDKAKQCLVKSAKGAATDPKGECAGLEFSGKGAKGTAQLKAKIGKIRDSCFEQANLAVSKAKFEQSKSLRTIQTDIDEKLNQINDLNEAMERKKTNDEGINTEASKEKTDEQKAADQETSNLQKKLSLLGQSTSEAVQHSNTVIGELQKELNDLVAKKTAVDLGILDPEELDNSYSDATALIQGREEARQSALNVCCPELKVDASKSYSSAQVRDFNKRSPKCGPLISGSANQADGGGRRVKTGTDTGQ
jgi:hypothetical protein